MWPAAAVAFGQFGRSRQRRPKAFGEGDRARALDGHGPRRLAPARGGPQLLPGLVVAAVRARLPRGSLSSRLPSGCQFWNAGSALWRTERSRVRQAAQGALARATDPPREPAGRLAGAHDGARGTQAQLRWQGACQRSACSRRAAAAGRHRRCRRQRRGGRSGLGGRGGLGRLLPHRPSRHRRAPGRRRRRRVCGWRGRRRGRGGHTSRAGPCRALGGCGRPSACERGCTAARAGGEPRRECTGLARARSPSQQPLRRGSTADPFELDLRERGAAGTRSLGLPCARGGVQRVSRRQARQSARGARTHRRRLAFECPRRRPAPETPVRSLASSLRLVGKGGAALAYRTHRLLGPSRVRARAHGGAEGEQAA